jgi:hypothetical protein
MAERQKRGVCEIQYIHSYAQTQLHTGYSGNRDTHTHSDALKGQVERLYTLYNTLAGSVKQQSGSLQACNMKIIDAETSVVALGVEVDKLNGKQGTLVHVDVDQTNHLHAKVSHIEGVLSAFTLQIESIGRSEGAATENDLVKLQKELDGLRRDAATKKFVNGRLKQVCVCMCVCVGSTWCQCCVSVKVTPREPDADGGLKRK